MDKMTSEQFCYWLQGVLAAIGKDPHGINYEQMLIIRDHLDLVLTKAIPGELKDDTEDLIEKFLSIRRVQTWPTPTKPWNSFPVDYSSQFDITCTYDNNTQ